MMNADLHERAQRILALTTHYDPSMEYTHYRNIHHDALTNAAYRKQIERWPTPNCPKALADRAALMVMTGFVMDRAFDACFEMGNGGEVMRRLIDAAGADAELKAAMIRGAYHIGDWDVLVSKQLDNRAVADLFASAPQREAVNAL